VTWDHQEGSVLFARMVIKETRAIPVKMEGTDFQENQVLKVVLV
jgi:hypothetical protein